MTLADRSMGVGLKALNALAGTEFVDRMRLRKPLERAVYAGSRSGFRAASAAGRTFTAASRLGRPARQRRTSDTGLFDVAMTDEQSMLRDSVRDFAAGQVRPAALDADAAGATPDELLAQTAELGVTMLGVPEELGGVVSEQSAVTTVLVAEALAHGDLGIAYAALAPGAVATAIARWGDADQQSKYLPAFVGDDPPTGALALLEPRPLFDPFRLETRARRDRGDYVLDGLKSLVARAESSELFVVAAALEDGAPALFLLESGAKGLFVEPEPAMGLRPASTSRLVLDGVRVPAGALLGEGSRDVYAECVARARIAWCALAVGTGQAVLDYVIPYVNDRVAFGEPLSNRQAVAFMVANIGIELEGMRLVTLRAASRADRGEEVAQEAALARRLCAERGMGIGSDGVQLLGGHGYVKEHPVERWYRDLRAAGVMEGALLV